jgi:hypothetical protein
MTVPLLPHIIIMTALSIVIIIQFILIRRLKNKAPPPPRGHSLELTEFLSDTKTYGYGFVRVDPGTVIQRSPRGDIP